MGKALYRKYRSKRLAEIVGQEHITNTLSRALESGKISHAYLFTGPRGVGKTSIARILAHELNNFPYTDDSSHLDIIEIDAASNRRIDEIRDLRERVHTAPTSGKYKVYIIDEVHMLTKEAFNALLKTLEEPPAHVIFILATTEAHKLPDTIISRTQRFTFRPIATTDAVKHLQAIADSEQLQVTPEALALIAAAGGGSFRDSISLLDQLAASGDAIDEAAVRQTLGVIPDEAISDLQASLATHQTHEVMRALHQLRDGGYQATQIAAQLLVRLREQLVTSTAPDPDAVYGLSNELLNIPTAHDPETKLELVLVGHALGDNSHRSASRGAPTPTVSPTTVTPAAPAAAPTPSRAAPRQAAPATAATQAISAPVPETAAQAVQTATTAAPEPAGGAITASQLPPDSTTDAVWQALLEALRAKYNTLYGIARMADPQFGDRELTLGFGFAFHQKRMSEPKNKQVLLGAMQAITGQPWAINCVLSAQKPDTSKQTAPVPAAAAPIATTPTAASPAATTSNSEPLAAISTIFGGAEVLDS